MGHSDGISSCHIETNLVALVGNDFGDGNGDDFLRPLRSYSSHLQYSDRAQCYHRIRRSLRPSRSTHRQHDLQGLRLHGHVPGSLVRSGLETRTLHAPSPQDDVLCPSSGNHLGLIGQRRCFVLVLLQHHRYLYCRCRPELYVSSSHYFLHCFRRLGSSRSTTSL